MPALTVQPDIFNKRYVNDTCHSKYVIKIDKKIFISETYWKLFGYGSNSQKCCSNFRCDQSLKPHLWTLQVMWQKKLRLVRKPSSFAFRASWMNFVRQVGWFLDEWWADIWADFSVLLSLFDGQLYNQLKIEGESSNETALGHVSTTCIISTHWTEFEIWNLTAGESCEARCFVASTAEASALKPMEAASCSSQSCLAKKCLVNDSMITSLHWGWCAKVLPSCCALRQVSLLFPPRRSEKVELLVLVVDAPFKKARCPTGIQCPMDISVSCFNILEQHGWPVVASTIL